MAKTRSKKRNRKRTMRGGITPLEMGIGAGVAGIAALLYAYLRVPSVPAPVSSVPATIPTPEADFNNIRDVRDTGFLNNMIPQADV